MINNIFCGSMTSNLDTWIHIQKLKVTSRTCEVHESVFYWWAIFQLQEQQAYHQHRQSDQPPEADGHRLVFTLNKSR